MGEILYRGGDSLLFCAHVYFKALSASTWAARPDSRESDLHVFDALFCALPRTAHTLILDGMRDRAGRIGS